MLTGNILKAPGLGIPRYKGQMLVPNGVRYRGVPLYTHCCAYACSMYVNQKISLDSLCTSTNILEELRPSRRKISLVSFSVTPPGTWTLSLPESGKCHPLIEWCVGREGEGREGGGERREGNEEGGKEEEGR